MDIVSSLSLRERGLKYLFRWQFKNGVEDVALLARAWIEITFLVGATLAAIVALLARAWIEMFCWLVLGVLVVVALLARAWIEIFQRPPRTA